MSLLHDVSAVCHLLGALQLHKAQPNADRDHLQLDAAAWFGLLRHCACCPAAGRPGGALTRRLPRAAGREGARPARQHLHSSDSAHTT